MAELQQRGILSLHFSDDLFDQNGQSVGKPQIRSRIPDVVTFLEEPAKKVEVMRRCMTARGPEISDSTPAAFWEN